MKTIFIPAKRRLEFDEGKVREISKKLPDKIAVAYSIQYKDLAYEIKKMLSTNHKITNLTQVLGCSKPAFSKNTQAILLLTDGKFHAVSLAFETKLPVYIFSNNNLEKASEKDVESLEKKQKASKLKFLNAENVGILISIKPGQENIKKVFDLKKRFKSKKSYLFIGNDINAAEFENFQIDSWVNTACPRLDMNAQNIINISDVKTV